MTKTTNRHLPFGGGVVGGRLGLKQKPVFAARNANTSLNSHIANALPSITDVTSYVAIHKNIVADTPRSPQAHFDGAGRLGRQRIGERHLVVEVEGHQAAHNADPHHAKQRHGNDGIPDSRPPGRIQMPEHPHHPCACGGDREQT